MEGVAELIEALKSQIGDIEDEKPGFQFMPDDTEAVLMFIDLFMSKNKDRMNADQITLMDSVKTFIDSKENETTTLTPTDLFEIMLLMDKFPEHADELEALADFVRDLIIFDTESGENSEDEDTEKVTKDATTISETSQKD